MKKIFENWRRYHKAAHDYENAKQLWEFKEPEETALVPDIESSMDSTAKVASVEKMKEVEFNTILAMSVFDGVLNEDNNDIKYIMHSPSSPNEEVVAMYKKSLYSGKRSGFLTYYEAEQLAEMKLYLVDGHMAGFAIKDGNDIVAVHNNTKGKLRGLAAKFLNDAKRNGGTQLDHFDGFLSGLYRKFGFTNVHDIWNWNGRFRADEWEYPETDIFNVNTSVYAEALSEYSENIQSLPVVPAEYQLESGYSKTFEPMGKYYSYRNGMPDIIYRKL